MKILIITVNLYMRRLSSCNHKVFGRAVLLKTVSAVALSSTGFGSPVKPLLGKWLAGTVDALQ